MLRGKRILVAEDNDWIAAALIQTITDYRGIALGPAQTNVSALALIDGHLDGAILDGNLLDGPITPVARALCDRSVPLVVFTGLAFPPICNDRTRISRSFSSHLRMRSSFTPLQSVCGSPARAPASKTRRDGSIPPQI